MELLQTNKKSKFKEKNGKMLQVSKVKRTQVQVPVAQMLMPGITVSFQWQMKLAYNGKQLQPQGVLIGSQSEQWKSVFTP